ncbi:MAG TPA: hypothetical protein VKW77_05770 [Acidimicrobiales bacterium]|nr:hypothetical protein [Acidimicrobiales bacterium]
MAGFVQLVEFETSDVDAVRDALLKFRDEHPGVLTSTGSKVTEDRDRPGTYVSIVEFASYEAAMEQSSNPALSELSTRLGQLMNGQPRFRNLDVRAELAGA